MLVGCDTDTNNTQLSPTLLDVNSKQDIPQNSAPNLVNVKINNKNDVQELYDILIHSPKLSNGPISCPKDNGISYKLNFKGKNNSVNIGVEPTGCEVITIGKKSHRTFMGNKKADEFWTLFEKYLNVDVKRLKYGNKQ